MILVVRQPVPSKKNRWMRVRRGVALDREIASRVASIVSEIRSQLWDSASGCYRKPKAVALWIFLRVERSNVDRDNLVTTLLDCMVMAGALEGDSVSRMNGWVHVAPAVVGKPGMAVVVVDEGEAGLEQDLLRAEEIVKGGSVGAVLSVQA